MPKVRVAQEVEIVRFFEQAPLEQATLIYNIVQDKMRTRTATTTTAEGKRKKSRSSPHMVPASKESEKS